METDFLTKQVIGCAIEVHRQLGPGLLESTYERCLAFELASVGIEAWSQVAMPIEYKGQKIDAGYRLDLLIPDKLVIELKAVDRVLPVHSAQLITYLKLAKVRTGLLINFNVRKLTEGLKRVVV